MFLDAYPQGRFANVARLKLKQIQRTNGQLETSSSNVPALYDPFENPLYDGSYNQSLWSAFNQEYGKIGQHGGELIISRVEKSDHEIGLTAKSYDEFTIDRPLFFEARLKAEKAPSSYVMMTLHSGLSTEDLSDCFIESGEKRALIMCSHNSIGTEHYESDFIHVDYGTWHTVRIETDPILMNFTYYIDGEKVGSFIPKNAKQLRKTTFHFYISLLGESPGKLSGYFDDIRIGDVSIDSTHPIRK
jgi:hypothetical protein